MQRQEHAIASSVVDEERAFLLVVSANKMDLLDLDGAEYTRQDFLRMRFQNNWKGGFPRVVAMDWVAKTIERSK